MRPPKRLEAPACRSGTSSSERRGRRRESDERRRQPHLTCGSAYAHWWIAGFTEGADPEYAEQILPLAAAELAGSRRVLDVGAGDGQISRLAARLPGVERVVALDPTWNQIRVAASGAERPGSCGRRPIACPSPAPRSTPSSPASCSSTSTPSTRRSPRSPACSSPAAGSASSSTTRCCRRPTAAGSTTRWSNRPSSTGASGPTSPSRRRSRRSSWACTSASSTARCRDTSNALVANGLWLERMTEPAPPPGFLALAPEYEDAATVPRLLYLRTIKR